MKAILCVNIEIGGIPKRTWWWKSIWDALLLQVCVHSQTFCN